MKKHTHTHKTERTDKQTDRRKETRLRHVLGEREKVMEKRNNIRERERERNALLL